MLREMQVSFESGLNIISGPNATGKTSVLEAIGYCLRGRSVLGSKDSDVVSFDRNEFQIQLKTANPVPQNICVSWNGRKRVLIDEKPIRGARRLVERFKLVFISPKSVDMVLGAPSGRREFLDDIASQINPEWAELIFEYRATIKDRNALLSSDEPNLDLLEILTEQVIIQGSKLREIRRLISKDIQELSEIDGVKIHIDDSRELSKKEFAGISRVENIRGITLIGPHRDGCFFSLVGNRADKFASTGEARRVTMILKLAGARIISRKSGAEPIILADDLLAELDEKNSKIALTQLEEFSQTILTNAGKKPDGNYNFIEVSKWLNQ